MGAVMQSINLVVKRVWLPAMAIAFIASGVLSLRELPISNVPKNSIFYYLVFVSDILVIIFSSLGLLLVLIFPFIERHFPSHAKQLVNFLEKIFYTEDFRKFKNR